MKKYIEHITPRGLFDCSLCHFDGRCPFPSNNVHCEMGYHFAINPAWKPASQRVRELASNEYFQNQTETARDYLNELANELAEEEKENEQ